MVFLGLTATITASMGVSILSGDDIPADLKLTNLNWLDTGYKLLALSSAGVSPEYSNLFGFFIIALVAGFVFVVVDLLAP